MTLIATTEACWASGDQSCFMLKLALSLKAYGKSSRVNIGFFRNELLLKCRGNGKLDWIK